MKKKLIIFCIVIIQLIAIAFLVRNIFIRSNVLGTNISVSPILEGTVDFPKDSELKYFYEPAPNRIINDKRPWLLFDYSYTITTNADSLNERFDYAIEKNPNVFRIITLSDSFTFGDHVNTSENYPERLEDMLNENSLCKTNRKFEIINLGFSGYDIEYSIHRFKVRGQKYNPDLLLWLIKNDDFIDINELTAHKKRQYIEEMMSNPALIAEFYKEGKFAPWIKKARIELMAELGEEGVLDYNKKALWRIRDYYKGRLVFLTFSSGEKKLDNSSFSILQGFAKERVDTYIYDRLSSNFDHFEKNPHPTGKGYAQIAGEIFDYMKTNHLIPCD